MNGVYTGYFQKSKVFLYPLLGIRKGARFVPENTYVCWGETYTEKDYKLICVYSVDDVERFAEFEDQVLQSNPYYELDYELDNNLFAYVFNLEKYKSDYELFITGSYSRLSNKTKNTILKFFGSIGEIAKCVNAFLNPTGFHENYAKYLGVSIESVRHAHEVCTPPDLIKECNPENIPVNMTFLNN